MFGFRKNKWAPIDTKVNMYHDLRSQALNLKLSQIQTAIKPGYECPVYGAVIDMVFGEATATMIFMLDGAASLYYSNGGGIIGVGEHYPEVREEGFNLLANMVQLLEFFEITKDFSLPTDDSACFAFFLTEDGVYKTAFHMDRHDEGDMYNFINYYIQNLLTSIRVNTQKDGY